MKPLATERSYAGQRVSIYEGGGRNRSGSQGFNPILAPATGFRVDAGFRSDSKGQVIASTEAQRRRDSKERFKLWGARHAEARYFKADAALTAVYARQLEHIMSKAYQARYWHYKAREFFPVNSEVDPGALTFTYRMLEDIGNAGVINNGNANDLPNVDVGGSEWQAPVITLGVSYNYTVIDQMAAAMANVPIEAYKAEAARRAIDFLEEQIFCTGYAAAGVSGVTNVPGLNATAQVSTGTWTSQILANAGTSALTTTVIQAIAADINACSATIVNQSGGTWEATNCLLPQNLWSLLKYTPQSTLFNSKSLLKFLEEMTGLEFDMWPALQNAGAIPGSPSQQAPVTTNNPAQNTMVLVYAKDPEVFQLIVPQPFTQLAPQPTSLTWEIPCFSRIGGVMSPQPLGATTLSGVGMNLAATGLDDFYTGADVNCCGIMPVSERHALHKRSPV
jgi:hypothetical protein